MAPETDRQENCFDFLRLFAASCVVIIHSALYLNLPFLWVMPGNSSYWFRDGVPLFFVLSGFLVYRSYERCVERNYPIHYFLANRWLRVAPAIYAYVIVAPALLLFTSAIAGSDLFCLAFAKFVGSHLLLLCSSGGSFREFSPAGLNGSLWTIPVECSFYLVVPLFYAVYKRWGLKSLGALMIVLAALGVVMKASVEPDQILSFRDKLMLSTFLPYMTFFGLGIVASKIWDTLPKSRFLAAFCLAIYLLVRIFNVLGVETDPGQGLFIKGSKSPLFCFAWSLPMAYWVLWIGHFGPALLGRFTRRVGDLSYGIYIWHMVVVQVAVYFQFSHRLQDFPGATQVVVLGVTVLLAKISWTFVEKPCLRLKLYHSKSTLLRAESPADARVTNSERRGSTDQES